VVDVPGGARVSVAPNPEQAAAIDARGRVFVSAGAGTGKTAVLVERFVRAVCDEGVDVDSMLVITYTKRAAGELRSRIRAELHARGRHELARELDGAWISTIHGFCNRLLKAYPFQAGLDPRFRELDEAQAAVLRSEAFDAALDAFCADDDPDRLRLLATYTAPGLRRMLTGIYETLRSAGRPLVLELGEPTQLAGRVEALADAARCLVDDSDASELQRANAARLLEILGRSPSAEQLLDLGPHKNRQGPRTATYEEARKRVEQAALDEVATRDRDLLQALLEGFAAEYAAAKRREAALDFEDLQLAARDLLRAHQAIREREQLRFRHVSVDEFQDTNRLQCELIDLIAAGPGEKEVFFVGDEFQSIYGFRHADVQVFRERRAEEGGGLALTRNYRSRPDVLAAVNHLFAEEFGDEFQPLAASGEFPDPVFGHPVELLVTDKASYAGTGTHWRRAEARAVARRVHELVAQGDASPGEIVLLFAAGTDAEWYEQELRALGLPTYRATGRGYFGQQQVVDLLAYLRLVHNRYDDQALVTVLASPFVGLSNDALVLLRRAAPKRPLFVGVERGVPELDGDDARLLAAFKQRYERISSAAPRVPLERLCEEIVAAHDYDLAVLSRWDGRRRYANLRKLARLARSYEELRGRDIEGFVRFVRDQEAVGARELEAVAEEEGADAIRLLTIHAAKGLEFKVVVVADAGREKAAPSADEILALSDGRFGFRIVDPATSKRRPAFAYDEVLQRREAEQQAERLRLYYVAMTRAIDRLIVAGSVDFARPDDLTPMGWVLKRLDAAEELEAATVELRRDRATLLVRVDRGAEEAPAEEQPAEPGQLALFEAIPAARSGPAPVLPELAAVEPAPLHVPRKLSFTAIAPFDRCSYRYYAERVAGMRPADAGGDVPGHEGLGAAEIGSAVHGLLEEIDLRAPAVPEDLEARVLSAYPGATAENVGRVRDLLAAYCASPLATRLAALEDVRREPHFLFEHAGVLFHGYLDVVQRADGRALVVDYKSNALGDESPAEVVEADYRLQRLVYALACLRAGADDVEVVYQFLERPDEPVAATYAAADVPALEAELAAVVEAIAAGAFRPTPSERVCAGCPALGTVCAGPRLVQAPSAAPAAVA
jgi:ATP-dependent helicase/nuclease subunit A